jgi:hypothetical protein
MSEKTVTPPGETLPAVKMRESYRPRSARARREIWWAQL